MKHHLVGIVILTCVFMGCIEASGGPLLVEGRSTGLRRSTSGMNLSKCLSESSLETIDDVDASSDKASSGSPVAELDLEIELEDHCAKAQEQASDILIGLWLIRRLDPNHFSPPPGEDGIRETLTSYHAYLERFFLKKYDRELDRSLYEKTIIENATNFSFGTLYLLLNKIDSSWRFLPNEDEHDYKTFMCDFLESRGWPEAFIQDRGVYKSLSHMYSCWDRIKKNIIVTPIEDLKIRGRQGMGASYMPFKHLEDRAVFTKKK